MNYRYLSFLKAALCISLFSTANLSAQPAMKDVSSLKTPIPTRDQWLKVKQERNASDFIRAQYKEFLIGDMAENAEIQIENIDEENPADAEALKANAKLALETKLLNVDSIAKTDTRLDFANFKDTTWYFFRESPNSWPTQLRKTRFTGIDTYAVEITVYCAENNSACNELVNSTYTIKPPQPGYPFGKSVNEQWLQIAKAEPCDPNKPVSMPNPIYPPGEARDGIVGQVLIRLEYNKCGDAVDVTIQKSSRNRNLDRAALDATRHWRIAIPVETIDPAVQAVLIPVSFHL